MNLQRVREIARVLIDTRRALGICRVEVDEVLREAMEIEALDPKDQQRAILRVRASIGDVLAVHELSTVKGFES